MTSASIYRSSLRVSLFSTVLLFAGATAALGQAPGNSNPSPFGNTSRLSTAGFANTGFQNSGFRNSGFRNSGFQNVGFRNSAPSNNGVGRYAGAGFANAPGNYGAPSVPSVPATTDLGNVGYNVAPQQYGQSLDPRTSSGQTQGYVPDDSAAIIIGQGTNLTSGYTLPTISRGARYTMGIGWDTQVGTTNPRLSAELQSQLANSQRLSSGKNIKVDVENNVVVLRGKVADAHERDLAEMFVRLSPGVYNVRNELQAGDEVTTANR